MAEAIRSYAEQTFHYFDRPHAAPANAPVESQAAWDRRELTHRSDWRTVLSAAQIRGIERGLTHSRATGKATGALEAEDFPLDDLAPDIDRWRTALVSGLGLHVISGIPVERWSQDDAERFFWCLGLHLGRPGAQNVQGDLLGHVVDTGDDRDDPFVRLYRTSADIAYHCDAADAVGLLCLRAARSGGASRIVSSVSVYNELARRRPDLVGRLYEPFLLDVRNEDSSGSVRHFPIPPCRYADGVLRTFYHSDYFRSVVRHDDVPPFTRDERELLDLYEAIATEPELSFDMDLAAGDIQLLSNHTVLHARTAYEDFDEPDRRRHLLRLWLSL